MTAGTGGGRRPGRGLLLVAAGVVLAGAALWLARGGRHETGAPAPEATVAPDSAAAPAGTRALQLVFGNRDATGTVVELRDLPARDRLEDELAAAVAALCEGPMTRGAVGVMPRGTRLRSVFYDEKSGAVLLDFSLELKANHPGGSAAERATIDSIMRTVALNFPEVRSVRLLIGGVQEETLAGHLGLDAPLDPRRWL